jgi:type VI secretion system protein ImpG
VSRDADRRRDTDGLLTYYEQELTFLRRMLGGFARDYPDKAGSLMIDEDRGVGDPHVERLIESVAVLTARTRLKLDDGYPLLTDSLLGIIQPQLVTPVPPMTIAQFELSKTQDDAVEGYEIPRGTGLDSLHAGDVKTCQFRTSMGLHIYPIDVTQVSVEQLSKQELARIGSDPAAAAIRIRLETRAGQPFCDLDLERLMFYVDGGDAENDLLEDILCDSRGVILSWGGFEETDHRVFLPKQRLRHVGFRHDEALLEYPRGASQGYRLLQEFFCFPQKFQFIEFSGLDSGRAAVETNTLDILALVDRPLTHLTELGPGQFKLGCVPVINLFERNADPDIWEENTVRHQVVPDGRNKDKYEVHSILEVESSPAGSTKSTPYVPFFALGHGDKSANTVGFWHMERDAVLDDSEPENERETGGRIRGSEVFVTLVSPRFVPESTEERHVLSVRGLFFNRDFGHALPYKDPKGDLRAAGKPDVERITCLMRPTATRRPSMQCDSRWRAVSSLALNHLSLVGSPSNPNSGLEAMKEILDSHDFVQSDGSRLLRAGLVALNAKTVTGLLPHRGPARGLEVELIFEGDNYKGTSTGVYLFASVLERFLAAYASINSFTQCVTKLHRQEGVLRRWPPRAEDEQGQE